MLDTTSETGEGELPLPAERPIHKIAYTFVIADLFHYGHLQLLKAAAEAGDFLICGVLTDEAVSAFKSAPISTFEERVQVVSAIRCVDRVMTQHRQDPTENLRLLSREFPDAELVFIYGSNWEETPGGEFLKSVRATLKKQAFYDRLSSAQIAIRTVESLVPSAAAFDTFTQAFVTQDFHAFRADHSRFTISTKAKTLMRLKPLLRHSLIEPAFVFTVRDWRDYRKQVLSEIQQQFRKALVVVRSSCLLEDTLGASQAGRFHSELDVSASDAAALESAIEKVIASYRGSLSELGLDQVLVQRQTKQIQLSGVVFTVDLESNAPYYAINYDTSERSDVVTGGRGGRLLKLARRDAAGLVEPPLKQVLIAVQELEKIIPDLPLDIEFAVTSSGQVVLFQVRPMTTTALQGRAEEERVAQKIRKLQKQLAELSPVQPARTAALSDMLFWNPAELIGHHPTPLAYDLFDRLITRRAWNHGLYSLGYPDLGEEGLMLRIGYKPYIRVDLAFRALIPESVDPSYHARLMHYYLAKLKSQPQLHDKAEFQIMTSCYDFHLPERLRELSGFGFSADERKKLLDQLAGYTNSLIRLSPMEQVRLGGLIHRLDGFNQFSLESRWKQFEEAGPRFLREVIMTCETLGTTPFASAARLAFVAESLLRSLVAENVIGEDERLRIVNSFTTIAGELTRELAEVGAGRRNPAQFLARFGHLRSGTYDLRRPRYDQMDLASMTATAFQPHEPEPVPDELAKRLNRYLKISPLKLNFAGLYELVRTFVSAREHFKFVFTKTVSNLLELFRMRGREWNIDENLLVMMKLDELIAGFKERGPMLEKLERRRAESQEDAKLLLPPLIWAGDDLRVLHYHPVTPNFITRKRVTGTLIVLDQQEQTGPLDGKIVFIEHADPGYHWLFSKGIAGLVTKYGGMASHMAICCAELGIPAAIGCGEYYDQLKHGHRLLLDCANHLLQEEG